MHAFTSVLEITDDAKLVVSSNYCYISKIAILNAVALLESLNLLTESSKPSNPQDILIGTHQAAAHE